MFGAVLGGLLMSKVGGGSTNDFMKGVGGSFAGAGIQDYFNSRHQKRSLGNTFAQHQYWLNRGLTPWELAGSGGGSANTLGNAGSSQNAAAMMFQAREKALDRENALEIEKIRQEPALIQANLASERQPYDINKLMAEYIVLQNQGATSKPAFVLLLKRMTQAPANQVTDVIHQKFKQEHGFTIQEALLEPQLMNLVSEKDLDKLIQELLGAQSLVHRELSGAGEVLGVGPLGAAGILGGGLLAGGAVGALGGYLSSRFSKKGGQAIIENVDKSIKKYGTKPGAIKNAAENKVANATRNLILSQTGKPAVTSKKPTNPNVAKNTTTTNKLPIALRPRDPKQGQWGQLSNKSIPSPTGPAQWSRKSWEQKQAYIRKTTGKKIPISELRKYDTYFSKWFRLNTTSVPRGYKAFGPR